MEEEPWFSPIAAGGVVPLDRAEEAAAASFQAAVGNRSLRPTRSATGSRNVRRAGSLAVMAWTATPPPSGKGSETISNSSPYM